MGSVLRCDFDHKTGQLTRQVLRSDQLQGSWESSLLVRAYQGRVEVSGNPSKWGRLEAVGLGCTSIFEAVAVYNRLLRDLGLPEFSYPDRIRVPVRDEPNGIDRVARQGPKIHRIDIAGNMRLGSAASVGAYVDWLSTQRVGRRGHPFRVMGPASLLAGTRRLRELAIYAKGSEVAVQLGRWIRKRGGDHDPEAVRAYLGELVERCSAEGWVRREVRLFGEYLVREHLQWVEEWGQETMKTEWLKYGPAVNEDQIGAVVDWKAEAYGRFLARGLGERAARLRIETLFAWMGGADVQPGPGRGKSAFYQIAKDIREAVGVDIRSRPNVLTLGSRVQMLSRPVEARIATVADVRALYRGLCEPQAPTTERVRIAALDGVLVGQHPLSEVA